jgi:geranylgeranylglycerol-phosphate geranylgeranyltransferase
MPALLRLVHPFPSALNALLVFAIATVAGGTFEVAVQLALAMLGLQFCIGAVNDLFDEALDAQSKPFKPIPAGRVSRRTAWVIAVVSGGGGLILAALVRPPDPVPLLMAVWMLSAGLLYDAVLKSTAFAWVCFSIAFPVLPLFAWYGAFGELPPRWEVLVPVAALAGFALQLSNGLIDLDTDSASGLRTLAVALGRRRSLVAMAATLVVIHLLALVTLPPDAPISVAVLSGVSGALALGGVMATAQSERFLREVGWAAQTVSIAVLAVSWLVAAAA